MLTITFYAQQHYDILYFDCHNIPVLKKSSKSKGNQLEKSLENKDDGKDVVAIFQGIVQGLGIKKRQAEFRLFHIMAVLSGLAEIELCDPTYRKDVCNLHKRTSSSVPHLVYSLPAKDLENTRY